jgi:hypothetical protein
MTFTLLTTRIIRARSDQHVRASCSASPIAAHGQAVPHTASTTDAIAPALAASPAHVARSPPRLPSPPHRARLLRLECMLLLPGCHFLPKWPHCPWPSGADAAVLAGRARLLRLALHRARSALGRRHVRLPVQTVYTSTIPDFLLIFHQIARPRIAGVYVEGAGHTKYLVVFIFTSSFLQLKL